MKKLIIAASLLIGFMLARPASAQVQINIGSQPVWGPVGYDYVEYYYLPDIDMYYHVPSQQYVYLANNRWIFTPVLPPHFRNYDIYHGYKVVINQPRPYLRHDYYRNNYAQYRGYRTQPVIRDSRDSRYYGNQGRPDYNRDSYANRNSYQQREPQRERYEQNNQRPEQRINPEQYNRNNDYRTNENRSNDNRQNVVRQNDNRNNNDNRGSQNQGYNRPIRGRN